ncbi:Gfo/Idh/MocA family protein [Paenibacillus planticolens]|nr:Gfo/Idh/MocA family oxidoreductase [Paenibacillus planticolens]
MKHIAILGCWNSIHVEKFAEDLHTHSDARLVAVWDENDSRAAAIETAIGVKAASELADILKDPNIDGVILSLPPEKMASLVIAALEAGKHVLADMYMAINANESGRIERALRNSDLVLGIDMSLKHRPLGRGVKEILDSGKLGEITSLRIRNAHGAASNGMLPSHFTSGAYGVFTDLGVHTLYLTQWLLGQPKSVTAVATHYTGGTAEDNAVCIMQYENGAIAIAETGYVSPKSPQSIELYGVNGAMKAGGLTGSVHYCLNAESDLGWQENAHVLDTETSLDAWLLKLNGSDPDMETPPLSGLEEGIQLAELIDAVYRSIREGTKVGLIRANLV